MPDQSETPRQLKKDWVHAFIKEWGSVLRTEIYAWYQKQFRDEVTDGVRDSHVIAIVTKLKGLGDVTVVPVGSSHRVTHRAGSCSNPEGSSAD
jgi:hypothetical protein